jgi:HSP20 family molecular chaperone IbpA
MSFTRTVWLPRSVDPNSVTAKLQNGVLSVALGKAGEPSGRVVKIE